MRIRAIRSTFAGCPAGLSEIGFTPSSQVVVTSGREYEVYAAVSFRSVVFFLVVDDADGPAWLPAWLFAIVNRAIPADWIVNALDNGLSLIAGPRFIADTDESYRAMVELETDSAAAFWSHVDTRRE
jgi:hypothetical protein